MVEFEIIKHIGKIGKRGEWDLELNQVRWNGGPIKIDIRAWNHDHTKCSKGITLTEGEMRALREALMEK